ncbi:MAG TPA: FtsX-like permease family protein [Acidimicrobiales bacterium]|nr:FtsX-like permease family protein [Acidimicrobiales bacterium]
MASLARWLRMLWLPPWRRAPLRAWRSPSLFLGVAVAAFVLGVAGASRPMFAASTARASLSRDVETGCRFDVGLRVQRSVSVADASGAFGPQVDEGTQALDAAVGPIEGVDPAVVTVIGDLGQVAFEGADEQVQLIERTGFRDHIDVLREAEESDGGVWLTDTVAERLGVDAGDRVDVVVGDVATPVPVSGVYRDLRGGRDRSWCSLRFSFEPRSAAGSAPPPVALFDDGRLVPLLAGAGVANTPASWEYPPDASAWDLPTAERATAALDRLVDTVNNRSSDLGATMGFGRTSADLPRSVHKAQRTSASVESVAGPVALGTIGVAVVMLLAAARSWLTRRSQDVTVLSLRGAGPAALALKGMAELLPALLLGAVLGVGSAVAVVRVIGPDPRIDREALADGVVVVAVALVVALVALAVVVGAGVRRVGVGAGGAAPRRSLPLWEPVVLALAGAAYYELHTRQTVVDDTRVDGLLLLFPLLLLAGGAGLAARLALSGRPLGWLAARAPTPAWLALRRLAAARLRAGLIVTGAAISIGIVVFATAMSSSVSATAYAKATLGHGSAQVVRLSITEPPPTEPPLPGVSTLVTRTSETGVIASGHDRADVLGVEPDTFADAAFWDDSFAGPSLAGLLERLGPEADAGGEAGESAVPAIGVGDGLPDRFVLTLEGDDGPVELPVEVVGRADAFPGLGFVEQRPLVVVDRRALTGAGVTAHAEVWVDDPSPAIAEELADDGLDVVFAAQPGADVSGSQLQPQVWAIDYLEVVGVAAGLVTVAGLGLYFAANSERRQLGAATARRLGLPAAQAALATALEVAAILAAGLLLGVGLAWLAVRLVFRQLDPLPNAPPDALLRFDLSVVAACGAAALVTALLVTLVVERRTARTSLPELLRDAG